MPAVDDCEPQVIRALAKAGWMVIERPVPLVVSGDRRRYIFADLRIRHRLDARETIVIEVKCFPPTRSILDDFYHAVGQYLVYRNALRLFNVPARIHLVIPQRIEGYLLDRPPVRATLEEAGVKLVVIDMQHEEVTRWET